MNLQKNHTYIAYRDINGIVTGLAWWLVVITCHASAAATLALQNEKPHIVMLISEDPDNYKAHQTIPGFADMLREQYDLQVTVIQGEGERTAFHFPGLEVLSEADLLLVFFRRIALTSDQLNMIKSYLKEGRPLVGIRTANHAFSVRDEVQEGYEDWWGFVPDILGCENRGYGDPALGTEVAVVAVDHPIMEGVTPARWHSKGNVYYVAPLLDKEATVLLTGRAGKGEKVEPIAWTRQTVDKGRVFYTSLGYPDDFKMPQFRQLLVNGIYWASGLQVP